MDSIVLKRQPFAGQLTTILSRTLSSTSPRGRAWTHVALAFGFMVLNYADKAVVGLASVPIMRELALSHTQFGALGSAFFLLFSVSGIVVGFIANHVSSKTLMTAMAVTWCAALGPVTWISSFAFLLLSRVVLGAAEGPAFPVAMHAVYQWFEDPRRALPTSIVACGAAFGTGILAPLISWIIARYGWHHAFGVLGLAGLLWALLWQRFAQDGPVDIAAARRAAPIRVPYRRLILSRTALGVFLSGFAAYWVIALNISWLANYLIRDLGVPAAHAAWIIALPSLLQIVLAPSLALLSQSWIRHGMPSRAARGLLGAGCVMLSGICIGLMAVVPIGLIKVILLGVGFSIGSVIFTLGSTLIGEISPSPQRGAMLGLTNSIHTVAGLCAPFVMGVIIDAAPSLATGFENGYLYAAALIVSLGLGAALLINPAADLARFRADPATRTF